MSDCRENCTCVIPEGQRVGLCERHGVRKTAALIQLCRTRPEYFEKWEREHGFGKPTPATQLPATTPTTAHTSHRGRQVVNETKPAATATAQHQRPPCSTCGKKKKMPPATKRALNFAKALLWWAADAFRTVDEAEYNRRLQICDACEWQSDGWCYECGCYLPAKASGTVWRCALGKWDLPIGAHLSLNLFVENRGSDSPAGNSRIVSTGAVVENVVLALTPAPESFGEFTRWLAELDQQHDREENPEPSC